MLAFVGHRRLLTIAPTISFRHEIRTNGALHKHNCLYIGIQLAARSFEDLGWGDAKPAASHDAGLRFLDTSVGTTINYFHTSQQAVPQFLNDLLDRETALLQF